MNPKKTNEMDDAAYAGIGSMQVELPPVPITSDTVGDSIAIGTPMASQQDARRITVYANNISPVSYNDDDPVVAFDVVFSVGIACDDGSTKTYQVVKRIGVDRKKIAADAESTTPVSIVEAKKPLKENHNYSTARFKTLAGLK